MLQGTGGRPLTVVLHHTGNSPALEVKPVPKEKVVKIRALSMYKHVK